MMIRDTDYTFAVARIRANERYLLTKSDIENLITAKDYSASVSYLSSKGNLSSKNETDVSDITSYQQKKLWNLLNECVPYKDELEVFTAINDFFNIKAAIKSFFAEKDSDGYFIYPTSVDTRLLKEACTYRNFDLLKDDFKDALKEAYEAVSTTKNGQYADLICDVYALSYMRKKASSIKNVIINDIADFIADSTNMKILYRCLMTDKNDEFILKALCDSKSFEKEQLLKTVRTNDGFTSLFEGELSQGAKILVTDFAKFEKWCDDKITEKIKGAKYEFFGFSPICAYYYAKQAEIKSVRLILSAKQRNIGEDIIRERVRELYV